MADSSARTRSMAWRAATGPAWLRVGDEMPSSSTSAKMRRSTRRRRMMRNVVRAVTIEIQASNGQSPRNRSMVSTSANSARCATSSYS
jgi:hypothetical protein